MEGNKSLDIASRSRIVKLLSLFDTERIKQFSDWTKPRNQNERSFIAYRELEKFNTFFVLHAATAEAFVQQPDAQPDIYAHSLLLNLSSNPVLDQNVGGIGT